MRHLGIDYGTKKVGIAVSDEAGEFAIPSTVIGNSRKDSENILREIIEIANKNKVIDIVMGESRDYKGRANAILSESFNLKRDLENKGFIVHLEPEFMTSVNAERFQGKNDMIDASAAALILQSFLDRKK